MAKIKVVSDIRITCKSDTFLSFKQIQDFQGKLKQRSKADIDHIIYSIERHGFSFPFFIWKQPDGTCSCLDGHGRILALLQMEKEGYTIPELPVVYIEASNEREAKTKLLQINTSAGKIDEFNFCSLIKDIPDVNLSEYHFPEIDLDKINIELKVLNTADRSITSDTDTNWSDIFAKDNELSGGAEIDRANRKTPSLNNKKTVNTDYSTSITNNEVPETICEERVVYCPDCGGSFTFKG